MPATARLVPHAFMIGTKQPALGAPRFFNSRMHPAPHHDQQTYYHK